MCETVGDFYDYLHEIIEKHEKDYNIEDGNLSRNDLSTCNLI